MTMKYKVGPFCSDYVNTKSQSEFLSEYPNAAKGSDKYAYIRLVQQFIMDNKTPEPYHFEIRMRKFWNRVNPSDTLELF